MNMTYIDRSFGNREEVEKYMEKVRKINRETYNNKKEFKKLFKMLKRI